MCSKDNCTAQKFRDKYPNYSFTTIGYSVSPANLNKEYQELIDVHIEHDWSGTDETHTCKKCKNIVYGRTHR